jgi:hypothetical protein
MITKEQLTIFEHYGGDIDGLLRTNNLNAKEIFGSDFDFLWSKISNILQDVEMLNKRLVSKEYSKKFFTGLKDICDEDSFKLITEKIWFYNYFQMIAELLKQIDNYIKPNTDLLWTHFNDIGELRKDINEDIIETKNCNFKILENLNLEFAPTSTYQELSMAGGWSEQYFKISTEFDKLYKILTVENKNIAEQKPWWKIW